jgi:hypothetical protein
MRPTQIKYMHCLCAGELAGLRKLNCGKVYEAYADQDRTVFEGGRIMEAGDSYGGRSWEE